MFDQLLEKIRESFPDKCTKCGCNTLVDRGTYLECWDCGARYDLEGKEIKFEHIEEKLHQGKDLCSFCGMSQEKCKKQQEETGEYCCKKCKEADRSLEGWDTIIRKNNLKIKSDSQRIEELMDAIENPATTLSQRKGFEEELRKLQAKTTIKSPFSWFGQGAR